MGSSAKTVSFCHFDKFLPFATFDRSLISQIYIFIDEIKDWLSIYVYDIFIFTSYKKQH